MIVSILTVGDELLAGDVVNTNAAWLASHLSERGVTVREVVVLPDTIDVVADRIREHADAADAVIVTGGVGGTPDDVTMDAIAAAFDRALVVLDDVVEHVEERYAGRDLEIDVEAWASLPDGSRPLLNQAGLSPGCVVENVYVLPGIPSEMEAMFLRIADEFSGDRYERTTRTDRSESDIVGLLERTRREFDVAVGCYPDPDGGEKLIKVVDEDETRAEAARDWIDDHL